MKRIVVVLGMGRSGTSLVCQALAQMGVSFGDRLLGPSERNERGHFEYLPIKNAQIQMMDALFGIRGWLFQQRLPSNWHNWWEVLAYQQRLQEIVGSATSTWPLFGFKDPMTARALPLWERIFSRLELDPVWIVCMRDPEAVYRSVLRTGEAFPEHVESTRRAIFKIWAEYTVAMREVSPACEIWFEDWPNGEKNARLLATAVGWTGALPAVYESELCHVGA